LTITYTAWNTVANTGQTGDAANHTLKWVKDGTAATPGNSNAELGNGEYKLTLTSSEMTCDFGSLYGTSSTANVVILPVRVATEHGVLPTVQQGNAGAVVTEGTGTAQILLAAGLVTVGTNNDKTGYALSATGLVPITAWAVNLTGNLTGNVSGTVSAVTGSVGSVTGAVGSVTGSVGSVAGNVGGNVLGLVGGVATSVTVGGYSAGEDPATLVLDVLQSAHDTAGTIGHFIGLTGGIADPLSFLVPGAYSSGTAGHVLGTALPDVAFASAGGLPTVGTGTGQIELTSGAVTIGGYAPGEEPRPKKNAALAGVVFPMNLTAGGPVTAPNVAVAVSLDGAAPVPATNTPATKVQDGLFTIDLAAADMNGATVALVCTSPAADVTIVPILTTP
jgi:hypothetical protein